jgi:uncharacterized cupredoxin-like copper-binding protein
MKRYQLLLTLAVLLLALILTACTSTSQKQGRSTHTGHEEHPVGAELASTDPEGVLQPGRTLKITANDQMRFLPEAVTVQPGETVVFEMTNTGVIPHEFIIGDAHVQEEHAKLMETGGDHGDIHHGDQASYALTIAPGETASLTYTFDKPGTLFYGCHVPGHYAAGMKGTINITAAN